MFVELSAAAKMKLLFLSIFLSLAGAKPTPTWTHKITVERSQSIERSATVSDKATIGFATLNGGYGFLLSCDRYLELIAIKQNNRGLRGHRDHRLNPRSIHSCCFGEEQGSSHRPGPGRH